MQNLQIRYPSSSPQVHYLSLYELDSEKEEYMPDDDKFGFSFSEPNFQEATVICEEPSQPETFAEFVSRHVPVDKITTNRHVRVVLEGLAMFLVGEIFEYVYLQNKSLTSGQQSRLKSIGQYKWSIFSHFLVLVILLWVFPILTLIILMGLYFQSRNNNCWQLETQKQDELRKRLNQACLKLKLYWVTSKSKIKEKIPIEKIVIQNISFLESIFCIKVKRSSSNLDDLDELVFKINKQKKPKQFQSGQSDFSLKIIYWKLILSNYNFVVALQSMNKIVDLFTQLSGEEHLDNSGSKNHKNDGFFHLFWAILAQKAQQTSKITNPSPGERRKMKNIISIIEKQISFKKIVKLRLADQSQKCQSEKSQQGENQAFEQQQTNAKKSNRSTEYQDGRTHDYEPESFESISKRLEVLMIEHEKKRENLKGKMPAKTDDLSDVKVSKESLRLERRSFGIPIMPPSCKIEGVYFQ